MILLHGNKAVARCWDFVVDASALPNRFIAPDFRGHGLSSTPAEGYRIEDYLADTLALAAQLGLARAVVVGTSTGGYVALRLAHERPDFTAAIAVVDSGIWIRPEFNLAPRQRVYESLAAGRAALDRSDGWPEEIKDHYARHSFKEVGGGRVEYRHFEQTETARSRAGFDATALRVACPTLIVRGDRSEITTEESVRRLQALIAGSLVATVPDCGHHVPMDRPVALAAIMDRFLSGL